jgi:two-component system response regulator YesN
MSPIYLGQVYKNGTGTTFKHYLNEIRIKQAKLLLQEKDWPIEVIAEKVGYQDLRNFYIVFKHYTGLTPKEYRQKANSCE